MRVKRDLGLRFQVWRESTSPVASHTAAATVLNGQLPPAGGGGGLVEVVGGDACYETGGLLLE